MPPQKTWFFQSGNGEVFATNEKEAFDLLTNKSEWRRRDLKMLGMSDGQTYHETIKAAGPRKEELQEQIASLTNTLNKYIAGHDKLMFEEFAEEDDPRVKRVKELIDATQAKIDPLESELKELRGSLIQRAFNAELEKARGNMTKPSDKTSIVRAASQYQGMADEFKSSRKVI